MISPKGLSVKVYSITGALVADYYSNVGNNSSLALKISETKNGGLDTFEILLAKNFREPLFTGMECCFCIDGALWFSGYAKIIPELDSSEAGVRIIGEGFVHKLKTVVINESYTTQTLDFIVKDICSKYLSAELNVIYDVAKITVPVVSGLTVEFNDKILFEVFESLLEICNYDFNIAQYRFWVDNDKYLNFDLIPDENQEVLFEGYQYQAPEVEKVDDKLVNKILAYRTTAADDSVVEFVSEYSDLESIANHGESSKKITFPDYLIDAGLEDIATGIIEKYKKPITRIKISDLIVGSRKPIGFYRLVNQRLNYFKTVSTLETLDGWSLANLGLSVPTISTDQVFTNRTAMKLTSSPGSAGGYMSFDIDPILPFPKFFRCYAYLTSAAARYTFKLTDRFGNAVEVLVGHNNEPLNEWIKYTVRIDIDLARGLMGIDKDIGDGGQLVITKEVGDSGGLKVDFLISSGLINITNIDLIVDSDVSVVSYFDQLDVESEAYKFHNLVLERADYSFGKAYTASMVFGDSADSLVDEIIEGGSAGAEALSIFSKQ